uniref:PARP-type domain-containing protein n=1 Tax=Spongospora subterranea TaxID=70186 RepID=A0A0H5RUV7_9EUKA|eukprot:CRZ12534.1 hypothetical protein [Spongospora subterranea]
MDLESLPSLISLDKEQRHAVYDQYRKKGQIFGVEYSTSSRANCRLCGKKILKKEVRIRHIVCGQQCFSHKKSGKMDTCGRWHLSCFFKAQQQHPEWFTATNPSWEKVTTVSQLAGATKLRPDDQDKVQKAIESVIQDQETPANSSAPEIKTEATTPKKADIAILKTNRKRKLNT